MEEKIRHRAMLAHFFRKVFSCLLYTQKSGPSTSPSMIVIQEKIIILCSMKQLQEEVQMMLAPKY
jgi:hypothetical protein